MIMLIFRLPSCSIVVLIPQFKSNLVINRTTNANYAKDHQNNKAKESRKKAPR